VKPKRPPSRLLWVSRGLSLAVAIGYLIALTIHENGVSKWTPLIIAVLIGILVLIWFPNVLGKASGYRFNRQNIDQPSPPILIAAAGWFFLIVVPAIFWWNWSR